MPIPYYHADSFTGQLFAGNPAGVCILRAFPADSTLPTIAAENRHSETAFVVARQDGDFDLRWFECTLADNAWR
jgi:PhzF family phenazine biosynthesis protein